MPNYTLQLFSKFPYRNYILTVENITKIYMAKVMGKGKCWIRNTLLKK